MKFSDFPILDLLTDSELEILNDLLPWSAFSFDRKGRAFGKPFSEKKRNAPQPSPDMRIVEPDKRFPLSDMTVLEVGCYEGFHTISLAERSRRVIAIDSRIENVVKTVTRCYMHGFKPDVFCWNLEYEFPPELPIRCDVLHHNGVLYHIADPVKHLVYLCSLTDKAIMLDTHVARESDSLETYRSLGNDYRYFLYREGGRQNPFAGMKNHAKWLLLEDLIRLLKAQGFSNVDVAQERDERNGLRVLIYASR